MNRGDFHIHTTYSDGKLTVDEVLEFAKTKVNYLAITDHDEVDGAIEAYNKAKDYGLNLILGTEVSTYNNNESVHILGYFKSVDDMLKVRDYLKEKTIKRRIRCIEIAELLKVHYNIELDVAPLMKRSSVTRGSIAHEMFNQGLVSTVKEAFEKYIGRDCKAYIPSNHTPTIEVINLLKEAGAKVFLAHPVRFTKNDPEEIIKMGVDGIEAFYSINTKEDDEKFLRLAKKYNLVVSAGSDFHLFNDSEHGDIGCVYLEGELLEKFVKFVKA